MPAFTLASMRLTVGTHCAPDRLVAERALAGSMSAAKPLKLTTPAAAPLPPSASFFACGWRECEVELRSASPNMSASVRRSPSAALVPALPMFTLAGTQPTRMHPQRGQAGARSGRRQITIDHRKSVPGNDTEVFGRRTLLQTELLNVLAQLLTPRNLIRKTPFALLVLEISKITHIPAQTLRQL